jgi:hypothetical protein
MRALLIRQFLVLIPILALSGCMVEGSAAGGKEPASPIDGPITGFGPISVTQNSSAFTQPGSLQTGVNGNLAGSFDETGVNKKGNWPVEAPTTVGLRQTDPQPSPSESRIVIYSAGLRLVVVSTADALHAIQKLATDAGGYMDEQTSGSITIRVPVARFNDTVASIEKLGEVVDRNIKAADITEQMIDLQIRLDNATKARERLLQLLAKSEKVEDTLKIESEIRRLTDEIETTKGKIRFYESRAAMSSIRVELNALQPQLAGRQGIGIPFRWIEQLGDGLIAGAVQTQSREAGIFGHGPSFKAPAGFVRYYQNTNITEAMDAADLRLKVQEHDNPDNGDLAFWTKLARRVLVETRALSVTSERTDKDASTIEGTREISGKKYAYLMTLKRTKNKVVTFEAWGPEDQFNAAKAAIEASSKTTSSTWW